MDWKQTIELSFKNRQRFVLRDSISEFELDGLRAETGFDWPAEFVELYQCHNGIGLIDQAQNRVDWIFVPSSEMPSFCKTMRDWFSKTHCSIAVNFFPFCNFEYSNAIGYLKVDGELSDSLYQFNHEEYLHRSDQDWGEFLTPFNLPLKDWLILSAELEQEGDLAFMGSSETSVPDTAKETPSLPGQENIDEFLVPHFQSKFSPSTSWMERLLKAVRHKT